MNLQSIINNITTFLSRPSSRRKTVLSLVLGHGSNVQHQSLSQGFFDSKANLLLKVLLNFI
jgi:hypothetical protein